MPATAAKLWRLLYAGEPLCEAIVSAWYVSTKRHVPVVPGGRVDHQGRERGLKELTHSVLVGDWQNDVINTKVLSRVMPPRVLWRDFDRAAMGKHLCKRVDLLEPAVHVTKQCRASQILHLEPVGINACQLRSDPEEIDEERC